MAEARKPRRNKAKKAFRSDSRHPEECPRSGDSEGLCISPPIENHTVLVKRNNHESMLLALNHYLRRKSLAHKRYDFRSHIIRRLDEEAGRSCIWLKGN